MTTDETNHQSELADLRRQVVVLNAKIGDLLSEISHIELTLSALCGIVFDGQPGGAIERIHDLYRIIDDQMNGCLENHYTRTRLLEGD